MLKVDIKMTIYLSESMLFRTWTRSPTIFDTDLDYLKCLHLDGHVRSLRSDRCDRKTNPGFGKYLAKSSLSTYWSLCCSTTDDVSQLRYMYIAWIIR